MKNNLKNYKDAKYWIWCTDVFMIKSYIYITNKSWLLYLFKLYEDLI